MVLESSQGLIDVRRIQGRVERAGLDQCSFLRQQRWLMVRFLEIEDLSKNRENRGGADRRVRETGTQGRGTTTSFDGFWTSPKQG
jgi:hypothetical protein